MEGLRTGISKYLLQDAGNSTVAEALKVETRGDIMAARIACSHLKLTEVNPSIPLRDLMFVVPRLAFLSASQQKDEAVRSLKTFLPLAA